MVAAKAAREPLRGSETLKPGQFRTRSGEILTFRSTDGSQFDIPEDLKEEGWTYQWQAHTVYNEPSNDLSQMYANGWRYVTSDSRVGKFFLLPGENADCIIRGGLVLMERPEELTRMYVEETNAKTRFQYQTLMDASSDLVVPAGFDNRGKEVRRERKLVKPSKIAKEYVDADGGIPDED
jgi:hypothetical protein